MPAQQRHHDDEPQHIARRHMPAVPQPSPNGPALREQIGQGHPGFTATSCGRAIRSPDVPPTPGVQQGPGA